jgi:UDPglucose 6-dehydrogenase
MIGIIGYGMVGKAVEYGFKHTTSVISDPQYNTTTINDVCMQNPDVIFVCVPTPTDDTDYSILKQVLQEIRKSNYKGLTVVKSTILPHHLEEFDILYNPEFLSRTTSFSDFVAPPVLVIGGDREKAERLLQIYEQQSTVVPGKTFLVDIKTAALFKYTLNSFAALKVTYMNSIHDVAKEMGVEFSELTSMLIHHPYMGTTHFSVPGPDGKRGFGGPCLPKDTEALAKQYDIRLLNTILELNYEYRSQQ